MVFQETIKLSQHGGGAYDITELISDLVRESGVQTGTCQLFIHSSMASLLIADVTDESTKNDTAAFLADLAPLTDDVSQRINRGMGVFEKDARQVVMQSSLGLPVSFNKPAIGVWQAIYLWDKSQTAEERRLTVTIIGE